MPADTNNKPSSPVLLREWIPLSLDSKLVKESREKNGGKIVLKGTLQHAEVVNQNGRIYPRVILEREFRNYQKFIRERRALGECDHPDSSTVSLQSVSHLITEARMEGDVVKGSVELLDTPMGKLAQTLVESGVTLGISSRGVGSTKKEGDHVVVQDDFQLIALDLVSDPSCPGAFLHEGKLSGQQLLRDLHNSMTKSDKLDRILNDILFNRK